MRFYSLQKGPAADELKSGKRQAASGNITDWTTELSDFADTTTLISALDLVITIDTAVAHLAGALGKPTWVLLPFASDWRWLRDRSDSPWYPTMRLFRQPRPGDWDTPVRQIAQQLKQSGISG
jgi:ADP-heptose:LPS heptosyltransferase